jgi:alpha-ketoglutarate-dependent 2,4-dichlorophenoxyacetate dioxygenase
MALRVTPLHPLFAGEASGVDLSRPLDDAQVADLVAAMDRHAVLVFRGQALDEDQQIAFARRLGPLDIGLGKIRKGRPHRFKYDALADISNVDLSGNVAPHDSAKVLNNLANQLWHSDSSFQKPPARYSMLYAVTVPAKGGETEFCDLRAAWDALPEAQKSRIAGLSAEHFALHSRIMLGNDDYTEEQKALMPPVEWPLVRTHPGSGRKLLWVGVHARRILGMPVPEGRLLLLELLEHATQRPLVFRHTWRNGDLVMWDNRAVLHRGRRFDLSERREMRRSTTEDESESLSIPARA